jgi:hypothetical protein
MYTFGTYIQEVRYLVSTDIRMRAIWFINKEVERLLHDLEGGVINKEQSIGSLNTLFNIASGIEDGRYMRRICRLTGYIRSNSYFYQIKGLYAKQYFDSPDDHGVPYLTEGLGEIKERQHAGKG